MLLFSCDLFDQKEAQPTYVEINQVSVKDPAGNSFVTHDIRDIWVYLNGQSLGVFPYPSYIPCLPEQINSELYFIPGIRDNGIASEVTIYPMLDYKVFEQNLVPGETYQFDPVFEYRKDIKIRIDEGFEQSSHSFSFDADDNPSTKMISTSTDAISGMHAGLLTVNDSTIFSQVANATILNDIPTSGDAVYLELDYKSEGDLFIGMIGYYDFEANSEELISYYLGLKKTDEWTKIYVNLSSELKLSGLPAYRILFRAEYSGSGSEEQILIDNVKLIHF